MRKLYIALLLYWGLVGAVLAQVALTTNIPPGSNTSNLTGSATFTTGASSATLTGASNKWTYICGFVVTSAGTTTAATGTITVTGTISGTMNFQYVFVSSGQGVLGIAFGPGCIQSANQNSNIVVNTPAGGAGTAGAVTAWGYTN